MEFIDNLVEEISTLIKESPQCLFKSDLRNLLKDSLEKHKEDLCVDMKDIFTEESYNSGYDDGYDAGYEDALNEFEDKLEDIKFKRSR